MRRDNYTDEEHRDLAAKYLASGMSIRQYARLYNVGKHTINIALRKYPLPPDTKHAISGCVARSQGHTVLVIPDLHVPFQHPDALDFLRAVRAKFQPTMVVCLGDEADFAAFSRYMPDPDGMTPGQELKAAIDGLIPFYREFPDVLVCESNHTVRPWKKSFEAGLPASFLPCVSKILQAPDGWVWASRHEVDGVLYTHGDNGKSGQYAHVHYMKQRKQSVVIGHIHGYAGVNYEGEHFSMNAGCLIDTAAYAFKYAKNMLLPVNIGCGLVCNGRAAHFLPLHMDKHGRWIGRL